MAGQIERAQFSLLQFCTTTMLGWTTEQRALVAETIRDLANIAVGAMVFGQFLGDQAFSFWIAIGGMGVWIVLVGWATVLRRE